LIDERGVPSRDLGNRLKDEREVFDRALIDVELFIIEHARRITRVLRRLPEIVDVDEHVTRPRAR
jgi:hypothetical protein